MNFYQKLVIFTSKTYDFGTFFNSGSVVLDNAAPDRPDTTHPGQAPDAQYTRPGQAGLRRTVEEIHILCPFVGRGWSGLHFTTI